MIHISTLITSISKASLKDSEKYAKMLIILNAVADVKAFKYIDSQNQLKLYNLVK